MATPFGKSVRTEVVGASGAEAEEDDGFGPPFPQTPLQESPVEVTDASSSSADLSGDSDGDEAAENAEGVAALSGLTAGVDEDDAPSNYDVWHHASTLTRHLRDHFDESVFLCGRRVAGPFVSGGSSRQPLCRQCEARA
jgi:hypothetical protein